MALLKGKFDPTLFNATALEPILREQLIRALQNETEIQLIDVMQWFLDELVRLGIIQ